MGYMNIDLNFEANFQLEAEDIKFISRSCDIKLISHPSTNI